MSKCHSEQRVGNYEMAAEKNNFKIGMCRKGKNEFTRKWERITFSEKERISILQLKSFSLSWPPPSAYKITISADGKRQGANTAFIIITCIEILFSTLQHTSDFPILGIVLNFCSK